MRSKGAVRSFASSHRPMNRKRRSETTNWRPRPAKEAADGPSMMRRAGGGFPGVEGRFWSVIGAKFSACEIFRKQSAGVDRVDYPTNRLSDNSHADISL